MIDMTTQQIISVIVPATIAYWKVATPQHTHDGKEDSLYNTFKRFNKSSLEQRYNSLKEKGFIK
jgi:hypothetical protein